MPEATGVQTKLNLEELVAQPTWRDELRLMVEEEQLDPWNIDIADVADKFIARMRKFQTLDLVLPANLILSAAILLHLKSEALKFEEAQVDTADAYLDEDRPPIEVPTLTLRTRIPPKRHVTLPELMSALEDAFSSQKRREDRLISIPIEPMALTLPEYNIEERMAYLLKRTAELADAEGLVRFVHLLRTPTREEIIQTLLPLLHLSNEDKLDLIQEPMFGEIFVQVRMTVT